MGRPARQTQVAQERRRRRDDSLDRMAHLKLAIPDEVQERHPDKVFRWVNDTPARMYALTVKDDWDRVDNVDRVPVGQNQDGSPLYAVLCAKPREFWDEDQRNKARAAQDRASSIVREGAAPQPSSETASMYATSGNTLKTEGYKP